MKITDLQIDGFGVWTGLSLNGLSPDLTVFYGPNEAGKSTLLQFVRSVCFGYSAERRRFLPPVHGGRPGGTLSISAAHGRFQVARHDDPFAVNGNGQHHLGTLQVTGPEGTIQSEAIWRALLAGIDEPTFNNVFAVGLRDVQELNTLSDTDAAQYLYDISAGRDRVSLAEVLRELEASRARLIGGTPEKPALIADLTTQRDRLQTEIDDLRQRTPRLGRLAAQGNTLKQECELLEAEIGRLQQQLRVFDLAGSLRPKWQERQAIAHQLEAMGPVESLPLDLLAKLDRLKLRHKKFRRRHARLVGELRIAKGEAAALKIDESLLKQAPRIEVLSEQIPFIQALEKQIATLEDELADLEHRHHARKQQLGISPNAPTATAALISAASTVAISGGAAAGARAGAPGVSRGWSYFRPTAARLRDARRKHQEVQEELAKHKQMATEVKTQVSSKLGARSQADMTADMAKIGLVVTQLRRRIQLEDKLKQLGLQKTELDGHVEAAFQEVLLPPHVIFGLGGLFVFGLVLYFTGFFFPASMVASVGKLFMWLGFGGMGIAGGAKYYLEHRADHHADHCSQQLDTLNQQIKEAEQERDEIDSQLPKGGGALTARLQAAEAQLASLQELLPLHTHKETTEQTARTVEDRARQADDNYQKAKQSWRKLLRAAGMEENLSPSDVAQRTREEEHKAHSHRQTQLHIEREQQKAALEHAAKREDLSNVEQIVFVKREEIANRRREHDAITARVKQLLTDAGLLASGRNPFEQLAQLRRDVDDQRALAVRRRDLHRRRKTLRRDVDKFAKQLQKLSGHRVKLLRAAGVANYAEVRRRTAEFSKFEQLRKQREALTHDIATALGNAFPDHRKSAGTLGVSGVAESLQETKAPGTLLESLLHEHLDVNADSFDARRADAEQRLQTNQHRFADLLQQRGELAAQTKTLLEDRRLQHKQLELSCIERKLAEAVERWQVLATTTGLLDSTRREFETERQPETLREASEYFAKLTEGRYRRVWTPLDEPILKVDDAEGHTIPVEKLSCGTREQLFLSLRLALAALYSRRGANLPLVLDDVLVNYDTNRARAAAQVLRDFAAEGHQLLVFTCHEHILDLFAELGVDARYLPVNGDAHRSVASAPAPIVQGNKRKPRRERKRDAQPQNEKPELVVDELDLAPLPPEEEKPRPSVVFVSPTPPPQPAVRVERLQPAVVPAPVIVAASPVPRATPLREQRAVAEHRRVDPPQERSVLYFQRGKWSAEEFDGELEDWVAVRVRSEDSLSRAVAAPIAAPVVAIRQGYAPEVVVEQKTVIGPRRATPLADNDFLGNS